MSLELSPFAHSCLSDDVKSCVGFFDLSVVLVFVRPVFLVNLSVSCGDVWRSVDLSFSGVVMFCWSRSC